MTDRSELSPAGSGPRLCQWYFDIVSPFAYLQWKQRDTFADRVTLKPVPVLLSGLLRAWGLKGPAEVEPKRLHTYRLCQWRADRLGIPFRFPPIHPFISVRAQRLLLAAGATSNAVDLVFDAVFQHGEDLNDMSVLDRLGRNLGLDQVERRVHDPVVKQALRDNSDAAVRRGVFGVPTSEVGEELFWGEDATALMLDFIADPRLFVTPEMARLPKIPSGLPQT